MLAGVVFGPKLFPHLATEEKNIIEFGKVCEEFLFMEFFMIDEKDFEWRLGRQIPLLEQTKYVCGWSHRQEMVHQEPEVSSKQDKVWFVRVRLKYFCET